MESIMAINAASVPGARSTFATAAGGFLAARGIHYGWVMLTLVFLFGVCAAAAMSVPGVLLTPMSADLVWSIGELSGPLVLRIMILGMVIQLL